MEKKCLFFKYPPTSLFQHFPCFPHSFSELFSVLWCLPLFSSCIHNAKHPPPPQKTLFFFLLICLPHAFAYFSPLQQKRVQAKIKNKWEVTTFLRCPLFWAWKHATSAEGSQLVSQRSLCFLTRMLHCSTIRRQPLLTVLWDAEQTRHFFLHESHPSTVILNTGQSYHKGGTEKPGEAALCAVTRQSHITPNLLHNHSHIS